jgi:hypothetical protein
MKLLTKVIFARRENNSDTLENKSIELKCVVVLAWFDPIRQQDC